MRYFWYTFGILLGYCWDTFGILLKYFWDTFWILLTTFRIFLGYFWDTFGILLGYFLDTLGNILGTFWYFWVILHTFGNLGPFLVLFCSKRGLLGACLGRPGGILGRHCSVHGAS